MAEEVDLEVVKAAFIPFGDLMDVQMPLDYESQKHRGFAFVEFEAVEDAAAAIDNMVSLKGPLFKILENYVALDLCVCYRNFYRMIQNCLEEQFELIWLDP